MGLLLSWTLALKPRRLGTEKNFREENGASEVVRVWEGGMVGWLVGWLHVWLDVWLDED